MISISGITIGTALLIIVLSVFNGFFDVVQGLLLRYDPDIRIESASERVFDRDVNIEAYLADIPEIVALAPFIEGKSLLAHRGSEEKVVVVRGIDPESFFNVVDLDDELSVEERDLSVRRRMPGILIGEQLTTQLSIAVEDRVSLLSAEGIQRAVTSFSPPRFYTFDVRGSFYLQQVYEGSNVFIELEAAQRMFNRRNGLSGYDLKLTSHELADQIKPKIQARIGDEYVVRTWYDLQKPLYDVMNIEKWSAYFILMIIVFVAVLNIVGSLTMIVIQKSRDIGILMSFGYTSAQIRSIFLRQGMIIGVIGCGIGGSLGLLLSWIQLKYEVVKLAGSESFIISAYPIAISSLDVFMVLAGSLILSIIAAWYPAKRAAAIDPAEAIRYD
jgi:lipoprotein-releasing system permease protein